MVMWNVYGHLLLLLLTPCMVANQAIHFLGPANVVAALNRTIELRCKLEGAGPGDRVVWVNGVFALGRATNNIDVHGYATLSNHYPRYRVYEDVEAGEYRLRFINLTQDDEGSYHCLALATTERSFVMSAKANVTVLVPPVDIKMRMHSSAQVFETSDGYKLKSNNTYVIRCEVGPSSPASDVTWKIGDVVLESMRNSVVIQEVVSSYGAKSSVKDSRVSFVAEPWMDGKLMACLASHPGSSRSLEKKARLSVMYAPYVNITLDPDTPLHRESSTLRALCVVLSKPPYERISWFISGVKVANATTEVLTMESLSRQHHNIQIQCSAENTIGVSYATMNVAITYGPRFLSKERLGDRWVSPGEEVTLTCDDVDSNPPPTITWFRHNRIDNKDDAIDVHGNGDTTKRPPKSDDDDGHGYDDEDEVVGEGSTLTFAPTESRAFGVYACVASTPGFKKIKREFLVGKRGKPTMVGPKEQTAVSGRLGSVTCVVRAMPRPDRITWYRNGHLVEFDKELRYSAQEIDTRYGRQSDIEILDTVDEDFTIFNCSAYNAYGFDSQTIVLRKREVVPFYCWIAMVAVATLLIMILATVAVCCKHWKKMPRSTVCCQNNKKLPSSDGSASTSQTSSDSMDLKRMCNLPDISIQYSQNKTYGPTYNKQSPTFDTLEQKQKLLQVTEGVEKSYTRFESPNHHLYNYHPNRPYPCDSPDCHSTLGMRSNVAGIEGFYTDRFGTCSSGSRGPDDCYAINQDRDNFPNHFPKSFLQGDCAGPSSTAFTAYTKLAPGNVYVSTPHGGEDDEYTDNVRRSQYNPALCIVPSTSTNRHFLPQTSLFHPPLLTHPPHQHSPTSGSSAYQPRGHSHKLPQSSYPTPSPTDSKLSTNV